MREDEEEVVSNYWMTLRKRKWKRKHHTAARLGKVYESVAETDYVMMKMNFPAGW